MLQLITKMCLAKNKMELTKMIVLMYVVVSCLLLGLQDYPVRSSSQQICFQVWNKRDLEIHKFQVQIDRGWDPTLRNIFQGSVLPQGTRSFRWTTYLMQEFMCPIIFPSNYDAPSQVLKLAYLVFVAYI